MGLYHKNTKLFPKTPNTVIPVCWITSGWGTEKQIIQQAVKRTWENVACITFIDWGTYSSSHSGKLVRLEIITATDNQGGASTHLNGIDGLISSGATITFNLRPTMAFDRIRYLAVHEFGHLLGFAHEQDSPDREPGSSTLQPWSDVIQIGAWDRHSIMNSGNNVYNNMIGYLSKGDIASIGTLYGLRNLKSQSDYSGSGTCSWGIWRPSTGEWFIDDGVTPPKVWGQAGDIPVPGDYNGDGKTDRAIWRPSTGEWFIDKMNGALNKTWGQAGDIPVPGDYNGDGKTDCAIWRPSTGEWFINRMNGALNVTLGKQGDIPVPGDYLGEGRIRYAVFRPSTGEWIFWPGLRPSYFNNPINLGQQNGDIPVPSSYGGKGITQPAIWRNGVFIFSNGWNRNWGQAGDIPLPKI